MPAWDYEAVDVRGRVARGRVEAESARGARDRLRAQGLTPVDMREGRAMPDALTASRLSARDLTLFTRQWATLAQSGLPVDQALDAVAEQADSPRTARLVTALRGHVEAGEPLPAALARFPRTFGVLYRGLVAAGAESGRLADVLARLADYLEARAALRQKFTVALIYPALVTLVALGVIAVLLVYVVPQVVAVYEHSRQTLPWLTRALIATAQFFRATAWLWIALAVAVPAPQALSLLGPPGSGFRRISEVAMAPCWTAMMSFEVPLDAVPGVYRWTSGPLTWAACDASKPGRPGHEQCWVAHASPAWSRERLEADARDVAQWLWEEFASACGISGITPSHLHAHRWRHAFTERPLGQPFLVDEESAAGACGDWCIAPRVEAAWDSGRALAHTLLSIVGRATPAMLR